MNRDKVNLLVGIRKFG